MAETDGSDTAGGAGLWVRYRARLRPAAEPDAMLLAAYAENRLGEAETEAVEAWLAQNPDAIQPLLALRAAAGARPLGASAEIAAARALLPTASLRPQLTRGFAWGSVAAGILVACLVGYEAGVATGGHTHAAFSVAAHEMGFDAGGEALLASAIGLGDGDVGDEL